jgi:hypothetical protein
MANKTNLRVNTEPTNHPDLTSPTETRPKVTSSSLTTSQLEARDATSVKISFREIHEGLENFGPLTAVAFRLSLSSDLNG